MQERIVFAITAIEKYGQAISALVGRNQDKAKNNFDMDMEFRRLKDGTNNN